ncbi:MAG: glutamate synthase large subunit [Candidatus Mycalebacterium zealandia]|nr:MAG: glutamate synthase large subunit [Candidatus Mycalebacterium zealandia]
MGFSLEKQGLYDPTLEHDACGVGFVVNIKGAKSHSIVADALTVLRNLEHRGACGCEPETGDGAGILFQIPHAFFSGVCAEQGIELPAPGDYGICMMFAPKDEKQRTKVLKKFEKIVKDRGRKFLCSRAVPTDNSSLGNTSRGCEPFVCQVFIGRGSAEKGADFERELFIIRKKAENLISADGFYISSISSKTIVYKGMLTTGQISSYYPDLNDERVESAIALVHSRFSTNTTPSWDRAHPYRYVIHNGEINTLRGNTNWMLSRQPMLGGSGGAFSEQPDEIFPFIEADQSDSAAFDNCLELLVLSGFPIERAVMMMVPEPWLKHKDMDVAKKAFYRYHGCLMEPWDGPASICFTDGEKVGAVLDRNGLRPSRYYVTSDDTVVLSSEVGVLPVAPEKVVYKGRLEPGRMLLVDTRQAGIVGDEEIKSALSNAAPYPDWTEKHMKNLSDFKDVPPHGGFSGEEITVQQKMFGYTFEEIRILLEPMAVSGVETVGAMGRDVPLAVLSRKPKLLYNYFNQMFAQVTNPPIDSIREEIVTASNINLGAMGNIFSPAPDSCKVIQLDTPVISNGDMAKIKKIKTGGFKSVVLESLFDPASGGKGLESALEKMFAKADEAIKKGANILVISDRGAGAGKCPIPALLAVGGLHHHLIRNGNRMKASITLESGEPREIHHFALLIGYGASAVNPYLAFETIETIIREGRIETDAETAFANYITGLTKGVIKIMSKMGISTIQSYHGAQIFEALGLSGPFVEKYFTRTQSRIGGIGIDVVAEEAVRRYRDAFPQRSERDAPLDEGGVYQWRSDGEAHMYSPQTVHALQSACRTGSFERFERFSEMIAEEERSMFTLRGMIDFKFAKKPVPLDEVEPEEEILKRFKTGAMSYGSISAEAHESLAVAMNRIGGKSNTGEGGEDKRRWIPDKNGDLRRSAIKQVASGRFGVTGEYLANSDEIQIKMAQGAKPGEGGQLPGKKVYPWIAKVRLSTPGVGLISPPPHHDIYSIEDLAELIYDLKNSNPAARINVKLVSEAGVGTIAAGVAKGHADVILISGNDGGTGASPQNSIQYAGLPWELGISETHQTLLLNNLRSRVVLETDGQMKTGRDIVIAALLGAEEYGFSTAPLIALGCVMMRVCHLDTCPVGVATQNPALREKFTGDPAHAVNFMRFVARQAREIMAKLGFRTVNEMIGRTDKLRSVKLKGHWKAGGVNLDAVLYSPDVPDHYGTYRSIEQDHGIADSLDMTKLLSICSPAIENREKVEADLEIKNTDRTVGTIVGNKISAAYGSMTLEDDTVTLRFRGSAGQSFAAFVPRGMTMLLEGDSNDYIGKGLSGGKIAVFPPGESPFVAEDNIIVGNVAFYGATAGEAYIRGIAGERFCVRNSGVNAVVEGVGDHGCEYMTGGRVVVLGRTGRNFAAGMSGGVAYVFDERGDFEKKNCNTQAVSVEGLDSDDERELKTMIMRHFQYTSSAVAERILNDWESGRAKFVKVMPNDYKRMLESISRIEERGLSGDEALMMAFEENIKDSARVGGN